MRTSGTSVRPCRLSAKNTSALLIPSQLYHMTTAQNLVNSREQARERRCFASVDEERPRPSSCSPQDAPPKRRSTVPVEPLAVIGTTPLGMIVTFCPSLPLAGSIRRKPNHADTLLFDVDRVVEVPSVKTWCTTGRNERPPAVHRSRNHVRTDAEGDGGQSKLSFREVSERFRNREQTPRG
jgi:hypothetical protein